MARDVNPGARSSNPYRLCVVGDVVYFSALNERWGEELWRSDGTELGTHLVRDIVVGAAGSEPYYKAPLGDALLFSARDSEHGFELWITDGSEGNTRLLRDIAPTMGVNPSSEPELLYAADPLLYFSLRTGPAGVELWRSDGSDGGTFMVKDLFPGPPSSNPGNFCAQGTVLYFAAESANAGIELWRTEGRAVSTSMVCDIAEGSDSSSPTGLVKLDSTTIIFAANDGINGMELWGSDGTPQGTKLIRNLHDDTDTPQGSYPQNLTRVGELVYFRADDGIHGSELWVTDGTYGGTRIVKDLIPRHNFSADPKSLTSVGNTLFYKSLPDGAGRWLQRIQEAGDGNTVANPSLLEPSEE